MATTQSPRPSFTGEYRHAIDEKNRVTIPSSWRRKGKDGDLDSDEFFLFPHPKNKCLTVMPPEVFRAVGEQSEAAVPQAQHRVFMRLLHSQAKIVAFDKQGRLLLPDDYCKQLGLSGDAVVAGGNDRFEIWSPANWKKSKEDGQAMFASVAETIGL